MKNYKDFEKEYIGDSDIAALTITFNTRFGVDSKILEFGGDSAYHAYVCVGDVIIGSHYVKAASGKTWLKIYDDNGLSYNERRDGMLFDIYRAGEYGCVIHWYADPEADEGETYETAYTKFCHIERFKAWIKETAKVYLDNIENYLDELEEKYMSNGTTNYELQSYETKAGRPARYFYKVEDIFDGDEFVGRIFTF